MTSFSHLGQGHQLCETRAQLPAQWQRPVSNHDPRPYVCVNACGKRVRFVKSAIRQAVFRETTRCDPRMGQNPPYKLVDVTSISSEESRLNALQALLRAHLLYDNLRYDKSLFSRDFRVSENGDIHYLPRDSSGTSCDARNTMQSDHLTPCTSNDAAPQPLLRVGIEGTGMASPIQALSNLKRNYELVFSGESTATAK